MNFEEWIEKSFPNKGNNEHTIYSIKDMKDAFFAKETAEEKTQTESQSETQDEKSGPSENSDQLKNKTYKAKTTSLIAQIIAALWVALWSAKNFIVSGGEINDIIFSGFAIVACFSPVCFNMILDKIKIIKFGE